MKEDGKGWETLPSQPLKQTEQQPGQETPLLKAPTSKQPVSEGMKETKRIMNDKLKQDKVDETGASHKKIIDITKDV